MTEKKSLEFLGFPNYEVDTAGMVWSCRLKGNNRHTDWHPLTLYPNGEPDVNGKVYLKAQLYGPRGRKHILVHHLVLLAFVGQCPLGMQCRHLNDNPEDNRLENLCWGTQEENMADLKSNGRFPSRAGERNAAAKLTREQVDKIRRLYKSRSERKKPLPKSHRGSHNPEYKKYTRKVLAEMFDVSVATIDGVLSGRYWT